jgi:hypothetical protein
MSEAGTYTDNYIKTKLEKSDIWVRRSFTAIASNDLVKPIDKDLFQSLADYNGYFDDMAAKHVKLIRKKLIQRYVPDLVKIANS